MLRKSPEWSPEPSSGLLDALEKARATSDVPGAPAALEAALLLLMNILAASIHWCAQDPGLRLQLQLPSFYIKWDTYY